MNQLAIIFAVLAIALSSSGQNTWTAKAAFPNSARQGAISFALDINNDNVNDLGYFGGGNYKASSSSSIVYHNDIWQYDPISNTWTQKANYPGNGGYQPVCFGIRDKGYAGAGYGLVTDNDFWEYDPLSNLWAPKADIPGPGRYGGVSFSSGGKGFAGFGNDVSSSLSDFYEYDPINNSWSTLPIFPGGGKSTPAGFSLNDKIYIGLGSDNISTNYTDWWEYDPLNGTWQSRQSFPGTARVGTVHFALDLNGDGVNDKGYVGLGRDTGGPLQNFWEYDAPSNSWTQIISFPGGVRQDASGVVLGSSAYVGFGRSGTGFTYYNDLWEFSVYNLSSGVLSGLSFCIAGGNNISMDVSFTSNATFNAGNMFTAQLSDASASFASPIAIGTLSGVAQNGIINCHIPSSTPSGAGYRVRVVSSNPAIMGSDNGGNIVITRCDDNDACTVDTCVNNVCSYTPITCNDNDLCTTDACMNGNCLFTADFCNDGNPCTLDSCSNGNCSYLPIICSDNNSCTVDGCINGNCIFTPIDCNDNNACTTDGCNNGECVQTPLACFDDNPCTTDSCETGQCFFTPIPGCIINSVESPEEKNITLMILQNPIFGKLTIEFSVSQGSIVNLELFNISGQRIAMLYEGYAEPGKSYKLDFHSGYTSSGIILYRLQTESGAYHGKVMAGGK